MGCKVPTHLDEQRVGFTVVPFDESNLGLVQGVVAGLLVPLPPVKERSFTRVIAAGYIDRPAGHTCSG